MSDPPVQLLPLSAKRYRAWCMYSPETYCARCDILYCGIHWPGQRCGFCGYELTLIPRTVDDRARARRLAGVEPSGLSWTPTRRWQSNALRANPSTSSSNSAASVGVPPAVILTANPAWTAQVPPVLSAEPARVPVTGTFTESRRELPLPRPRQSKDDEVIAVDE